MNEADLRRSLSRQRERDLCITLGRFLGVREGVEIELTGETIVIRPRGVSPNYYAGLLIEALKGDPTR